MLIIDAPAVLAIVAWAGSIRPAVSWRSVPGHAASSSTHPTRHRFARRRIICWRLPRDLRADLVASTTCTTSRLFPSRRGVTTGQAGTEDLELIRARRPVGAARPAAWRRSDGLVQIPSSAVIVPFFNWIDGLWQLWDKPYQQCLHDKVAQTVVIKVNRVTSCPGWYKDPVDQAVQRYWDGEGWIGDAIPADEVPPAGATQPSACHPRRRRRPLRRSPRSARSSCRRARPCRRGGFPPWPAATGRRSLLPPGTPLPPGLQPQGTLPPGGYPSGAVAGAAAARPAARRRAETPRRPCRTAGSSPGSAPGCSPGSSTSSRCCVLNVVVNGWFVLPVPARDRRRSSRRRSTGGGPTSPPATRAADRAGTLQVVILLLIARALVRLRGARRSPTAARPWASASCGSRSCGWRASEPLGFGRAIRRWNPLGLPTLLWTAAASASCCSSLDCLLAGDRLAAAPAPCTTGRPAPSWCGTSSRRSPPDDATSPPESRHDPPDPRRPRRPARLRRRAATGARRDQAGQQRGAVRPAARRRRGGRRGRRQRAPLPGHGRRRAARPARRPPRRRPGPDRDRLRLGRAGRAPGPGHLPARRRGRLRLALLRGLPDHRRGHRRDQRPGAEHRRPRPRPDGDGGRDHRPDPPGHRLQPEQPDRHRDPHGRARRVPRRACPPTSWSSSTRRTASSSPTPTCPTASPTYGDRPNVVVLRTLSKAWGLAGLRVGYLVGRPEVAAAVRKVVTPFSTVGVGPGRGARRPARPRTRCSAGSTLIVAERERVVAAVRKLLPGRPGRPSRNFVWLPLRRPAAEFAADCEESGVIVRAVPRRRRPRHDRHPRARTTPSSTASEACLVGGVGARRRLGPPQPGFHLPGTPRADMPNGPWAGTPAQRRWLSPCPGSPALAPGSWSSSAPPSPPTTWSRPAAPAWSPASPCRPRPARGGPSFSQVVAVDLLGGPSCAAAPDAPTTAASPPD